MTTINLRSRGPPDAQDTTPSPASATPDAPNLGLTKPNPSSDIMAIVSSDDLNTLSPEGKTIVSIVLQAVQVILNNKDETITKLLNHINSLESKVMQLQDKIDDIEQYERRDTLIVSGPALPSETPNENSTDVVVRSIKENLHVNINPSDVNVAHRLGTKRNQNIARPIIVKLHSRQKKSEIIQACITVKPNLYVNESLTPKRRALFKTVWDIRKKHRELFQQCYTQEGKIIVKLKSSNLKEIITTDETLSCFLDKHPIFKQSATNQ